MVAVLLVKQNDAATLSKLGTPVAVGTKDLP